MKARLRRIVVITLMVVCFGTVGFSVYLDEHFYRTRPRRSEPQTGRIYPQWVHHGTLVYLTRVERWPFQFSWYVSAISAMAAYFLNQRWKAIQNPSNGIPKKFY